MLFENLCRNDHATLLPVRPKAFERYARALLESSTVLNFMFSNEFILIATVALLLYAAKRLPDVAEPVRRDKRARASFFLLLTIIIGLLISSLALTLRLWP